jgi:hypothetical protein
MGPDFIFLPNDTGEGKGGNRELKVPFLLRPKAPGLKEQGFYLANRKSYDILSK